MNNKRTTAPAFLLSVALLASSCGANNGSTADEKIDEPTTAPTTITDRPESTDPPTSAAAASEAMVDTDGPPPDSERIGELNLPVPDVIETTITKVAQAVADTEGRWVGFDPMDHPAVIAVRDADGAVVEAIAINHPKATELGDAQELSTERTPFTSLHRVENLRVQSELEGIGNFDFNLQLAGVDTFAITSDPSDSLLNGTTDEFAATFIHELFHRYQFTAFTQDFTNQDVDGYDYSPENLVLAALEERALIAAHTSRSTEEKFAAAEHIVALRQTRLEADERIALDNSQERYEGSARWMEHLIARDDGDTYFTSDNLEVGVGDGNIVEDGVKDWYGFGRFYGTGAAILGLAADLGATDIEADIEAGQHPIDILAGTVKIDDSNRPSLVEAAKVRYDGADLVDAAQRASKMAPTEGDIFADSGADFGGDSAGNFNDAEGDDLDGATKITPAELECLSNNGFDIESAGEIGDELWETCFPNAA